MVVPERGFFVCPNMNKILKISKLWLSKAIIVAVALVLAVNLNIHQARAASLWEDVIQPIWANTMFAPSVAAMSLISITGGDSLMSTTQPQLNVILVTITAYSSTHDQTDGDPFTTASGKQVVDGIVAANFLKFGTKIQIPELFGDKVFVVEDRMARRHNYRIDIWFPNRSQAKRFGIQEAEVIVL